MRSFARGFFGAIRDACAVAGFLGLMGTALFAPVAVEAFVKAHQEAANE